MRFYQLRNLVLIVISVACLGFTGVVGYLLITDPDRFRAPIGGRFALETADGKRVTDADFRGRYMLIYFGYTHCPDVCPTKLIEITHALEDFEKAKPEHAERVAPIFITVDPARDSREVLGKYIANFHPRFIALTGAEKEIAKLAASYKVYYRRVPTGDGKDYVMDHTAYVFLLGPDGRYVTHFTANEDATAMARNLAYSVQ